MKILLIDNYDSFTYNIVHLFAALSDVEVVVIRNDNEKLELMADAEDFDGIIIGPGPGDPTDPEYFGKNADIIRTTQLPLLGICLGFQGMATVYGASLKKAAEPKHGKTSIFSHSKDLIFSDCPDEFNIMRYHSLMIDADHNIPDNIEIIGEVSHADPSFSENGREIMALKIKDKAHYGVQFHPESFASEYGTQIAQNFIEIIKESKP
jgi:anthranilate synthase/aminodeoxychorismate synthase-like glutamine amidotransferase